MLALVDTGSPVSFTKLNIFERYIGPSNLKLIPIESKLRNLNDNLLEV